jgi:hypothetical protein
MTVFVQREFAQANIHGNDLNLSTVVATDGIHGIHHRPDREG